MFFFDMLLALFLELSLVTGETGAIVILSAASLVTVVGGAFLANYLVEALVNPQVIGGSLGARGKSPFSGMSDQRLARHLAKKPRDARALRERIRRERATADPAELAAQIEALLAMKPKLEIEDLAMLHHQLADLYCGPLGQRLLATQVLAAFAEKHPESREAQFMRDRIAHIGSLDAQ